MGPLETYAALIGLVLLAFVSASILLWSLGFTRLYQGQPMLALEDRQQVPWGIEGLILSILMTFVLANILFVAARMGGWIVVPNGVDMKDMPLPTVSKLISIEGVARLLAFATVACLLVAIHRATRIDLGFRLRWTHIVAGIVGTITLLPPTFLLQALLTKILVEYEHPVLELLESSGNLTFLVPMAFVAVVVAPITEEFMFRVVLQGWLEKLGTHTDKKQEKPIIRCDVDPAQQQPIDEGSTTAPQAAHPPGIESLTSSSQSIDSVLETNVENKVPYWPILASSLIFAIAHVGQGPAPITLFFLSLGLGYLYRQTHSIWPSLIVHFTLNAFTMIVAAIAIASGEKLG